MTLKRTRGSKTASPPPWYPKNYNELNPTAYLPGCPDLWETWKAALDKRYGKFLTLEKLRRAEAGCEPEPRSAEPGETIRGDPNRMPPWLVMPSGKQPLPPGLDQSMLFSLRIDGSATGRGDHMATLSQPGFTMWFNMDSPDDVLREGFEHVLGGTETMAIAYQATR
jgi:hypothetical protein